MPGKPTTVKEYLNALPDDRRKALEQVRQTILDNLDKDYEEGIQYGMIGYYVPHRVYPDGYHCDPKQPLPFASIASQKNHMAIYLMCIYGSAEQEKWLKDAWAKSGKKKPDMGKSCIRFKKIDDIPLDVIGEAIRRVPAAEFIRHYESVVKTGGKRASSSTTGSGKKKASTSKKEAVTASRKKRTKAPSQERSTANAKSSGRPAKSKKK